MGNKIIIKTSPKDVKPRINLNHNIYKAIDVEIDDDDTRICI